MKHLKAIRITGLILFVWVMTIFVIPVHGKEVYQPQDKDLAAIIERILSGRGSDITAEGESVYSAVLVRNFYTARAYQPAWSEKGRLKEADKLIRAIEESYADGLTPDYYHLKRLKAALAADSKKQAVTPAQLADMDILMSDAFITLGCHLSGGCVDPVTMKAKWYAARREVDVASLLDQAVKKKEVREALSRLRPVQAAYENLKQYLARYREMSLKNVWPKVSSGSTMRKGDSSERVLELKKRFAASGELTSTLDSSLFDEPLEKAVISFQGRHGLEPDGVVGHATLSSLNVSIAERVRQIELNLERLRWILGNTEQRFIIVNIADFRLDVIEDGKSVLSMKVVVGKRYQKTPVFTAKMKYLIFNPVWNVPDSIAKKEILLKLKKDPGYLSEQNMKVLKGWGDNEKAIDPATIDWQQMTAGSFNYRFRQEPGPLNPLGRIKFMFPNSFDVYLHDTPSKRLFSRSVRTFSHGCTRIEKPIEMAEYLLKDNPKWTKEKILAEIDEGKEKEVPVPRPLNVNFIYLTAWVDENHVLQFRDDIYGRDKLLDEALGTGLQHR